MSQQKQRLNILLTAALTGGISTGKSIVAEVLRGLGCYVENADETARKLMFPGLPVWQAVVKHFGHDILNSDETINRKKLGEIIFSNPEEKRFIDSLIHPLVLAAKKKTIAHLLLHGTYRIYISEAALTIESGSHEFFDRIIVTSCKPEIQIRRLMERDGIGRAEALKKITSQMPQDEKKSYADYLIDTSGSMMDTLEQTERLYRHLVQDYELKKADARENTD